MAKKSTQEAPRRRVPLTTTKWEAAGVEEFPGELTVCEYRESDDRYNETRGFPRPIEQWHVEVTRLDAVYRRDDGSLFEIDGEEDQETIPVRAYMTCDLERLAKDGKVKPVELGNNKTSFALQGWEALKIKLDPDPTVNVGRKYMWKRYRTKLFGTFPAKDIIVPIKVLSADYEWEDDPIEFIVSEKAQADGQDLEAEAQTARPTRAKTTTVPKGKSKDVLDDDDEGEDGDDEEPAPKKGKAAPAKKAAPSGPDWPAIARVLDGYEEDDDFSDLITDPETKALFADAKVKKMTAAGDELIEKLTELDLIKVKKNGKIVFTGEE